MTGIAGPAENDPARVAGEQAFAAARDRSAARALALYDELAYQELQRRRLRPALYGTLITVLAGLAVGVATASAPIVVGGIALAALAAVSLAVFELRMRSRFDKIP